MSAPIAHQSLLNLDLDALPWNLWRPCGLQRPRESTPLACVLLFSKFIEPLGTLKQKLVYSLQKEIVTISAAERS